MDHAAIGADDTVLGEEIIDFVRLHPFGDLLGVFAADRFDSVQVMHRGRIRSGLHHRWLSVHLCVVPLGEGTAFIIAVPIVADSEGQALRNRSEEHTSELQSLMRISYAVFCLKKKNKQ